MKENPIDEFLIETRHKKRSKDDIFRWWESRRLRYNFICLIGGIISIAIIESQIHLFSHGDAGFYLLSAGIMFVIGNIFYFAGFLIEIMINRNEKFGPTCFIIITVITLLVLFFPAIFILMDKYGF